MASLTSLSNSPVMQTPRPPMPDSLQGKVDETGYSLNRSRSIANLILEHLTGPQLGKADGASRDVPPARSLDRDMSDHFHTAHELEDLLIRIQNALGTSS